MRHFPLRYLMVATLPLLGCGKACGQKASTREIPFEEQAGYEDLRPDSGPLPTTGPKEEPARCTKEGAPYTLPLGTTVGGALVTGNSLAVGLVGPAATVVHFPALALTTPTTIPLGPSIADGPAPSLAALPGGFAATWLAPDDDGKPLAKPKNSLGLAPRRRKLQVAQIDASGAAKVRWQTPQGIDEVPDADVAFAADGSGLAAWDDDAANEKKDQKGGLIRVVPLAGNGTIGTSLAIAIDGSEAESPRVVRDGNGWQVAWIARKATGQKDGEFLEGAGEEATFSWVEVQRLDGAGKLQDAPITATPKTGHVTALAADPRGGAFYLGTFGDTANDGGRLRRLVLDGKKPPVVTDLLTDGVARGLFDVIPSAVPEQADLFWFLDGDDGVHLLASPRPGQLLAPVPSLEPTLEEARPLLRLDGERIVAAKAQELFVVRCKRL
jgi:hypothetical protein